MVNFLEKIFHLKLSKISNNSIKYFITPTCSSLFFCFLSCIPSSSLSSTIPGGLGLYSYNFSFYSYLPRTSHGILRLGEEK